MKRNKIKGIKRNVSFNFKFKCHTCITWIEIEDFYFAFDMKQIRKCFSCMYLTHIWFLLLLLMQILLLLSYSNINIIHADNYIGYNIHAFSFEWVYA